MPKPVMNAALALLAGLLPAAYALAADSPANPEAAPAGAAQHQPVARHKPAAEAKATAKPKPKVTATAHADGKNVVQHGVKKAVHDKRTDASALHRDRVKRRHAAANLPSTGEDTVDKPEADDPGEK